MASNFQLKAVVSAQDALSPALRNIARSAGIARKAVGDIGASTGQLARNITGVLAPLGALTGLLSAGGLAAGIGAVVRTSAEFEKMETTLTTITGSAKAAKDAMGWVSKFATETPYEIDEVTQAFVKLKGYGIDAQKGALESAGNAAAAMGKPLMQAVEAIADAMTGENERLKEFGITSKKVGDDIVYRWVENGKKMATKVAASDAGGIEKAIRGIWDRRFGGGMAAQSKTFYGIVGNIKDTWTRFLKAIGDAGIFDLVKDKLSGVLDQLNAWQADGTIDRVAKMISDGLIQAFKDLDAWLRAVDWRGVWNDVKGFADQVKVAIDAVGGFKGVLLILAGIMTAQALAPVVGLTMAFGRLGVGLTTLAAQALVPQGALASLSASLTTATASAGGLMGILGKLGAVAAAGAAGYAVGSVINDQINGQIEKATGVKGMSLGSWLYDQMNPDVGKAAIAPSAQLSPEALGRRRGMLAASDTNQPALWLGGQGQQRPKPLEGEIKVTFDNAPPGMRVVPGRTNSDVTLNPDVGYGSMAMGMP